MTTREQIAAAANAVDGIEITPYYELVSTPGQGWVERLRTEYPNKFGGEDYWGIVVVLPQELKAAQLWVDEMQPRIVNALQGSTILVSAARPQFIPVPDNQSIRALVIEGHREAEE